VWILAKKKKFRITIDDEVLEVEVEVEDPRSIINSIRRLLFREQSSSSTITPSHGVTISVSKNEIRAPLAGRILSIEKHTGEEVKKGEVVLTMESMKTKIEIRSPISGILRRILVKEGQVVKQGELLAIIK